jgi:hypothetical protein
MGAAATISLPQTSRLGPSWLAAVWSSGFGGRLNFLCASVLREALARRLGLWTSAPIREQRS